MNSVIIIPNNGTNERKDINSIHFVVQVDGVNSSNINNLVTRNTDITNIDRYNEILDFLDNPNITSFY